MELVVAGIATAGALLVRLLHPELARELALESPTVDAAYRIVEP